MSSSIRNVRAVLLVPILITLTLALFLPKAAQDCTHTAEFCWNCSSIGYFTAGSVYEKNLNTLFLSTIIKTGQNDIELFRNASSGQSPDEVNAIGLCRGDVNSASLCATCLNETSRNLLQWCQNRKEAIMWGLLCMIRYSSQPIFSIKSDEPRQILASSETVPDNSTFKEALMPLLNDLVEKAASSATKFAMNSTALPNGEPLHAVLQCTPDLSQTDCSACLNDSASKIQEGKEGGRVFKPSCTLRFRTGAPFDKDMESTAISLGPPSSPPPQPGV